MISSPPNWENPLTNWDGVARGFVAVFQNGVFSVVINSVLVLAYRPRIADDGDVRRAERKTSTTTDPARLPVA